MSQQKNFCRLRLFSLTVLVALVCASCNSLRVYVTKTLPPDFSFNAGQFAECCTNFALFAVFEQGSDKPLWKISSKKTVEREQANSLVIHYGKIPTGFEQQVPMAGEPPPLVEGKTYLAVAGGTSYVPWARVIFAVKDNQTVVLPSKPGDNP
jgi:hypothetical protein